VIKNIIRGSSLTEMEALARDVLDAEDVDEAESMVLEVMQARFPEHLLHGGGQRLAHEQSGATSERPREGHGRAREGHGRQREGDG
jgi:hypothetical protein